MNVSFSTDTFQPGYLKVVVLSVNTGLTRGEIVQLPGWTNGELKYAATSTESNDPRRQAGTNDIHVYHML